MIQLDLCFYVVDSSPKFLETPPRNLQVVALPAAFEKKNTWGVVIPNDPRGDTLPKFNMEPKNDGFQ